jgi:hypothetical protein
MTVIIGWFKRFQGINVNLLLAMIEIICVKRDSLSCGRTIGTNEKTNGDKGNGVKTPV